MRRFIRQKPSLTRGPRMYPKKDPKRLTNGRFGDTSGNLKNRGRRPMIFVKNMKFRTSPKLKPKRLTNGRFSRQKWTHAAGSRMHPKMTQNALQMPDFVTFPEISKIAGDDL